MNMRTMAVLLSISLVIAVFSAAEATLAYGEPTIFFASSFWTPTGTSAGVLTNTNTTDGVPLNVSEEDVTGTVNALAMLLPNADLVPSAWTPYGCTDHYDCVNDPAQDGNTTIIVSPKVGGEFNDAQGVSNMAISDITIDGVTPFSWTRRNQSNPINGWQLKWGGSGFICSSVSSTPTMAFANISGPQETEVCGVGGAWSITQVDSIFLTQAIGGLTLQVTTTMQGIVVQYDDSDYVLEAIFNFTSVSNLTSSAYLEVTARSPGIVDTWDIWAEECVGQTWESIRPDYAFGDNYYTARFRGIDVYDCSGTLTLRITDHDATDESGATLSLDYLAIVAPASLNISSALNILWLIGFVVVLVAGFMGALWIRRRRAGANGGV